MNVLSSGIDTIVLALEIEWLDDGLFKVLRAMKSRAKEQEKDNPGVMRGRGNREEYVFGLRPFGARGYEWILSGKEFNLRIGDWLEQRTRPNVMVEIGSEILWRVGPLKIVEKVGSILTNNGANIKKDKVSRADLCVDIVLSEDTWTDKITDLIATRAKKWNLWMNHKGLESLTVGTGTIKARLYDKPLEIRQVSKKRWMFDVWGRGEPEEGEKIIRVEFQMRREVLKELGVGVTEEFFKRCDEAWSYCSRKWLKFQEGKGKHHTQRKTVGWWEVVQNGFYGVQDAAPSIREKAMREDEEQLRAQIVGCACSLAAIDQEKRGLEIGKPAGFEDYRNAVFRRIYHNPDMLHKIKENVIRKRAKYSRPLNEKEVELK